MKMAVPVGILVCLVIVSMGLTTYAIASDSTLENESNNMEENNAEIQARSDYPDIDDLSSFFDFEIGPPSITYQHLEDTDSKKTHSSKPAMNKNYYYYNSEGYPKYKNHHYHHTVPTKKQVVTPGTHYKSSTQKTFIEDDPPINESKTILNQAKVGQYQVSIVDANSPVLSNLGLTPEDLERLSNYNKRTSNNATMIASDSTASATYAENPRSNHPQTGYVPSQSQNAPSYPPRYESPNESPTNYGERPYKAHDHYHSSGSSTAQDGYSHASAHPPPQGSYDPKSYRALQGTNQATNNYNYPPPSYNHPPPPVSHSNSHPPPTSYNGNPPPASYNGNPPPASYNGNSPPASYNGNPPPASYNGNPPASYNNNPPASYNSNPPASYNKPPPSSYSNPQPASYNNPPPPASYNSPSRPTAYSPQRSSGEPWRQSSQVHTDWDDKQTKHQDSWQSTNYPPHPPPLPYSSNPGSSGTYYSKPTYGTSEKTGPRPAASYAKPESTSKSTYSSSVSSGSSEYSSHKPSYYPSSSYSSSKIPSRAGAVSYAASSHHEHPAPAKPGITIRFKAKAPSHGGSGGHGLSIPLNFSPLDVVKKLIPSLNPLNNKKVTIGITIENKKEPHHEYHSY